MSKVKATGSIVELDGDEMARVVWASVKERLILPFVEVDLKYYDLSLQQRDVTDDQVTIDAANAIKRYGVGVKCSTIAPNEARVEEFGLKKRWKSPNHTIHKIIGGVVLREQVAFDKASRSVTAEALGVTTSLRVASDGRTAIAQTAHGTVTRHYRRYQVGEATSTNPIATIFAWTTALKRRASADGTPEVALFAESVEDGVRKTVASGIVTRDLAALIGVDQRWVVMEEFIAAVEDNLLDL